LALRRILGVAAIMGLGIAMGIVAWVAYTSFLNSTGVVDNDAPTAVSTPNAAELALAAVPDAQVSNILPETEPEVAAAAENTATPNPLLPKNIIQGDGSNPRARWTATPPPTQTPTPSPTWVPTFVSPLSEADILKPVGLLPNERWIDVSLSTQSLVAYEGDTPVFETLISSGLASYPTVTGQFRIWLRYTSQTMDGSRLGYDYYLEGVPYVQYFYEDYALHGTYWHSNFGRPMSHGCVNLSTPDSEWLYNFADYGTVVNVHE
jgi:lipoprotein-anchoring transpeptidase ErfK/SrfK